MLKDHPSPDKAQQPRNHKGLQVGVRHHSERHRYVAARPGSQPGHFIADQRVSHPGGMV